jgi:hypothetical protein
MDEEKEYTKKELEEIEKIQKAQKVNAETAAKIYDYTKKTNEEYEGAYDLTRLIDKMISSSVKNIGNAKNKQAELTGQIQKAKQAYEEQKVKVIDLQKHFGAAQASVISQKAVISDITKALEKNTGEQDDARKIISRINADMAAYKKLEEDVVRLEEEKVRNTQMRIDLANSMEKAILTGNQKEYDSIRKKQMLLNDVMRTSQEELDNKNAAISAGKDQYLNNQKAEKQEKYKLYLLNKQHRSLVESYGEEMANLAAKERGLQKIEDKLKDEKGVLNALKRSFIEINETNTAQIAQQRIIIDNENKKIERLKSTIPYIKTMDRFFGNLTESYGKTKKFLFSMANPLTRNLAIVKASLDRWVELDKAAMEFRKNTGFLVSQTKEFDKSVREVNVQMQHLGVGLAEAYEAASALTGEFQVIGLVTKEAIANTAMMAANLGLNVKDAAQFKGLFESISESVGSSGDSMIKSAAALAEMGGVAPRAVLNDMANASEETLAFLAKSPMALMRATVEARRLGTTVNSLSKSARGFLNYQDSITSELEASALIGKSLNFQEARAAAYAGDVVKSRELALKQIEKAGDFTKLNVYQQEALAKAAGMTTGEIIKQQNQQKLLAKLEQTKPELYKKYMEMQEKIKENEKAAAEDLGKQAEEMAKQQLMQGELNKLTNAFNDIWVQISDSLLAIANTIMPPIIIAARLLGATFKIITAIIRGFLSPFDKFVSKLRSGEEGGLTLEKIMTKIGEGVEKIIPYAEKLGELVSLVVRGFMFLGIMSGKLFTELQSFQAVVAIFEGMGLYIKDIFTAMSRFSDIGARISSAFNWIPSTIRQIANFTNMGFSAVSKLFGALGTFGKYIGPVKETFGVFGNIFGSMGKIFGSVGRFVGLFGKAIPGIGQVITAIQILWELGTSLFSIWTDDNLSIGQKIIASLKAVPGAIFDVIVSPLIDIGAWILKMFGVDLTDGMIDGFKASAKEIFTYLMFPFIGVYEWIAEKLMGQSPSEIGLGIVDGIKSIGGMLLDALTLPFRSVVNFISGIFGGDGSIGETIINGIKSVMGGVFDLLVSPFKNAFEVIKKLPFVGKLFGGGDATATLSAEAKADVEKQVAMAVEVKNINELKETVDKLTEAISKLGGTAGGASPVVNVNNNQNAMIEKLDELIGLLKDGAIAVNMDGILVSRTLAKTS